MLTKSPFDLFDFDGIHTSGERVRTSQESIDVSPQSRELSRLRALNRLAEHLNRSADLKSALEATLSALVDVMDLKSAWLFLSTESFRPTLVAVDDAPHDFVLASYCGLPPGLEQDNRHFLRRAPDCRCQGLLRAGRLTHAVNMVECSRLRSAARAAGDTEGLKYHATAPIMAKDRPLGIINIATENWEFFSADDLTLLSQASELVAGAIERAELFDRAENQRANLAYELEAARVVQAGFMPRKLPEISGFSLAAEWNSALKICGDFYDIFPLRDNLWGIVLADVSGKGTPSGLYSARVRTLIQEVSRRDPSPSITLQNVNHLLLDHSSDGMFVTVFYAVLDPASRSLTYTNAGHDSPFLRRHEGALERLPSSGPFLGIFEDLNLVDATVYFANGDSLIVYTDGATDAVNPEGDYYSEERLASTILEASDPSNAPALKQQLVAALEAFTKNAPQEDDITFFVMSCCE
jgi:serine phosphatase RsbU (regulator of sigma subunit)